MVRTLVRVLTKEHIKMLKEFAQHERCGFCCYYTKPNYCALDKRKNPKGCTICISFFASRPVFYIKEERQHDTDNESK